MKQRVKKGMRIWDHVYGYFEFYDVLYLNLLYHEKKEILFSEVGRKNKMKYVVDA